MRLIRGFIVGLGLSSLLMLPVALAGQMSLLGAGKTAAAAYVGPGDIVNGATFHSCARAYNATSAASTINICDLVDSATPGVVICTLKLATTGFVDLAGTYCTGSVTPAAKCAAATGGVCKVAKIVNQVTPGTGDMQNGTTSQYPTLTFSALGGLPGLTTVAATPTFLLTVSTYSFTQPNFSVMSVAKRTNSAAYTTIGFNGAGSFQIGGAAVADNAALTSNGSNALSLSSITDSAFHSLIGVLNGASSVLNADGTETTGNAGTTNVSASVMRFGRLGTGGGTPDGTIMETYTTTTQLTSQNRTDLTTNAHSAANGYNF